MMNDRCEIALLLDSLAEAFDRKSWHGPNLRGSIRGITAEQAAWRPGEGRHNIWELALHAAYWKYVVRRKLTGEKRGAFTLKGSNFFPRPEAGAGASEAAWRTDIAILEAEHKSLCEAVAGLQGARFADAAKWAATLHLIRGAAAHDLYHAGQIRLLRRLCPR
ncbi:MAG TPA: DinB family protein [Bryobacteraceae bacterium]